MIRAALAAVALLLATGAHAEYAALDAAFEEAMRRWDLSGLAIGVVERGEVTYARTAGVIDGERAPVTRESLFRIASNGKAMTAATLARLVDAGRLRWNDPVVRWLPRLRMHDPWVTHEMQVRDLLIHDSGLRAGAGDLMLWPQPNAFTRADVIAGLAHLKPIASFRSRYDYDNLMYVVAGEVAAAAGGAPYEEMVGREVFAPLGMRGCRVGTPTGPGTFDAAGGIRCSLDDMLVWLRAWLRPDARWLSPASRTAMWSAQMPMPVGERQRAWDGTHFSAYGYGWRLADVDGRFKVSHTGSLSGAYSAVTFLPQLDVGFVVLTNGEAEEARAVLAQVLAKHWTAPKQALTVARVAQLIADEPKPAALQVPDTSARVPLALADAAALLGTWRDPWFGEVSLCAKGSDVEWRALKSPLLAGRVMRVGERLLVDWHDERADAEAWLVPVAAAGDRPAKLTLAKVDPNADFSWDFEDLELVRERGCDSDARSADEAGAVDVRRLVPDIALDMRYAGSDNFVGARIDGYEADKCFLLRPAAEALARVERRLRREGHRVKVFDCYRPVRAVRHFMRWAQDLDDQRTKPAYHPDLDKSALVPDYIAPSSGHSRGATLDLTLLRCRRDACRELDMGTPFDFFGPLANTDSPAATRAQRRNRERLRAAMQREGFVGYALEWWHYTLQPEPTPDTAYDFPVR